MFVESPYVPGTTEVFESVTDISTFPLAESKFVSTLPNASPDKFIVTGSNKVFAESAIPCKLPIKPGRIPIVDIKLSAKMSPPAVRSTKLSALEFALLVSIISI